MMNRSLFCTLCLSALLATLAAPAWAASLGDVISALETPFQTKTDEKLRIYDYSADFFQESAGDLFRRPAHRKVVVDVSPKRAQALDPRLAPAARQRDPVR